jgi:1-acyl-sn-glycerol-3-phosphate acyltransferase
MKLKWFLSWILVNFFFRIILGLRVEDAKKIPKGRGVILCPNHISSWDPPLVGAAVPREAYFLAKEDLFRVNKFFAWLIRTYNAVPIRRETGGHGALRTAMKLLRENKLVVVFPEGTRNRTNDPLLPLKPGAALLSLKTGVPIIPCYILGSRSSPLKWILRREPLCIKFGNAIEPGNYSNTKEGINKMTEDLKNILLDLRGNLLKKVKGNKESGKLGVISVI